LFIECDGRIGSVQLIQINPIGIQTTQTVFACTDDVSATVAKRVWLRLGIGH
jgi:hypothetical protein